METATINLHIEHLVEQIVQAVHPLKVIVFGSVARGQAGPRSDVDLLIIVPEGTHQRRTAQHLYEHLSGNGLSFDLLVATPSTLEKHRNNPGLIYRTILEEGWEVYAA